MVDHGRSVRPLTRPTGIEDCDNDSNSCNLSASWIDIETTTDGINCDKVILGSLHSPLQGNEETIRANLPIVVNDLHFVNLPPAMVADETESSAVLREEGPVTPTNNGDCRRRAQTSHPQDYQHERRELDSEPKEGPADPTKSGGIHDDKSCVQRYVEIIDTHCETIEGYDWEGILDLRNRMKRQQQEEEQQHGITAVQYVTDFKLYLTDGLLGKTTEEASLALDYARSYKVMKGGRSGGDDFRNSATDVEGTGKSDNHSHNKDGFVEFVESPKRGSQTNAQNTHDDSPRECANIDEEGYATPALSPLDVLTNSLLGARAFRARHHRHPLHDSVRLTELTVGGHSLELGESSIERLASALACCGGVLKRLVLNVSAVDRQGMNALADCFRATVDSLEDLHFYARQTTERLVGSRHRYKSVPAPCVLGPGISSWVDAWTSSGSDNNSSLRSLNLSRMDVGDDAAFALSRLLLAGPRLEVLNLAQDDRYGRHESSHLSQSQNSVNTNVHQSLSFTGTKRLLESLILIEDIKNRSRSSSISSSLSCSNLLELDISGWVLEDDDNKLGFDEDDEKAVDDFYDDYNYIDDGTDEDGFEFADFETSGDVISNFQHNRAVRRNQRACCVIASMLRCNTTLRKLVLVAEDGSSDTNSSGTREATRRFLSVRSTLAIARALRDHVPKGRSNNYNNDTSRSQHRSPGSNLRTLVLSTNYTRGMTARTKNDSSSWAITERKRAVAKVFYQALKDRPIHELRLQELSFTRTLRGMEPLGGGPGGADFVETNNPACKIAAADDNDAQPRATDLRDQLEFLLQQNRTVNQSLENIYSFWLPKISSLNTRKLLDITDADDNDEEDDCDFVETIESDANATKQEVTAAAARWLKQSGKPKHPPPVEVLALPTILARAGQEAARHDVVFHCARILANRTKIWELTAKYRCDKPRRRLQTDTVEIID